MEIVSVNRYALLYRIHDLCRNVLYMRNKQSLLVQLILWISIWSFFAFTASISAKDSHYFLSLTIRVVGFVLFYNIVYYLILPLYVDAKKNKFYWVSIVAYIIYVLISIAIDMYLRSLHPEPHHRHIPVMFIIIPPMILALAIFGTAAAIKGFSEFEKKKISEEEANNKRLEAEIQLLKSQINPHFMLNSLNNLYALSLTDTEKTPDAILKLSQMVSYILYECPKKNVQLSQDIEFIKTYIDLQRLRLPSNIVVNESIPDNISESYLIEPMVLISFIENAFKHGITTKEKCEIFISINVHHENLELIVQNPVWNMREGYNGNQSGIGIMNTKQRLEHSYQGKYNLEITNNETIHTVTLKLKLDK